MFKATLIHLISNIDVLLLVINVSIENIRKPESFIIDSHTSNIKMDSLELNNPTYVFATIFPRKNMQQMRANKDKMLLKVLTTTLTK